MSAEKSVTMYKMMTLSEEYYQSGIGALIESETHFAEIAFRASLNAMPSWQANVDLSQIYANKGDFGIADEFALKAITLAPNEPEVYANVGWIQQEKGNSKEAEYNIRIAINKWRKLKSTSLHWHNYHLLLADTYKETHKLNLAMQIYQKVVKEKAYLFDKRAIHQALWGIGLIYHHWGLYRKAIPPLKRALIIDPNESTIWCLLGDCYFFLAEYTIALNYYKLSLKLEPESFVAYSGLIKLYGRTEEYLKAEIISRKMLEIYPDCVDGFYWLGAALDEQGKMVEAVRAFQQYLKSSLKLNINDNMISKAQEYLKLKEREEL